MPYRAVVFDLFNTLVPDFTAAEQREALRLMAQAVSMEHEAFAAAWIASTADRWSGAHADTEATVRAICAAASLPAAADLIASAVAIRDELRRRYFTPRPEAVSTLVQLRRRGLLTGLISDCSMETPNLWPSSPLAPLIDAPVFSCRAGLRKPDPRIYQLACRMLGVHAAECLYVGDGGSGELTGAVAAGMAAVQLLAADESWASVTREPWSGPTVGSLEEVIAFVKTAPVSIGS